MKPRRPGRVRCNAWLGRVVVNLFWREAGYPGLLQSETWQTAECPAPDVQTVARRMVSHLRRTTAGVYRIRVSMFERPNAAMSDGAGGKLES